MADKTIQLNVKPVGTQSTWLDYRHPAYRSRLGQWIFARTHYTGDVLRADRIKQYLVRKAVGESEDAYDERVKTADYTNHFGAVVDSIAGMLFAVEGSANRVLNLIEKHEAGNDRVLNILGDPADPGTAIGRLFIDADGEGNGYMTVWKLLAIELLVVHDAWLLVDPADGDPLIKVFPAESVVNWLTDDDGLAAVLVEEEADARESIRDEPTTETRYVLFERDGWTRWRRDDRGAPQLLDEGEYYFEGRNGVRELPIFPVSLPLKRMVGWQLAKKANAIFNQESARDNLLRVANFPKLNLIAGDELFDKLLDDMIAGANALQVDPHVGRDAAHHYIAPDSGPADIASRVIERKVEEFYAAAFRMYQDSAQQKSATEARQDVSSGVGAFLQLLKSAIDDAENNALWRLEQVLYPNDRKRWFVCRVERTEDFLPADVEASIKNIKERYFGITGVVPIGRTARIESIKQMLGWDGVQYNEDELEAAVDFSVMSEAISKVSGMPIPTEVQVMLMLRLLVSTGLIDIEQAAPDGDMARALEDELRRAAELNQREHVARAVELDRAPKRPRRNIDPPAPNQNRERNAEPEPRRERTGPEKD